MKDLKAGVSKIDITPQGKIKREGYLLEMFCDQIHDPLFAKGLVLQQKDTRIGIICCDLLWLKREFTDNVLKEIEKRTGILQNNLMVACSHTHSGPQTADNPLVKKEEKYLAALFPKLVNVIAEADKNLIEVKLGVIKGREDTVCRNSRFQLADGTIAWRGLKEGEIAIPTGPVDPEVGIIFFKDFQDKFIATLYNYTCHASAGCPDISADYPGVVSRIIEKRLGGLALFTRGSCGNIHPTQPAEKMGIKLGEEIVSRAENVSFHSCAGLESIKEEIALPLKELDPEQIKEIDYICEQQVSDKKVSEARKDYFRKAYISFRKLREKTDKLYTFIQVIRIGDAILAGIPGEQFVEFGLKIKNKSKYKNTFIVNLANDGIGYIPTKKAYAEGGYQTWIGISFITPEAGEMIVEKVLNLIEKITTFS